MRWEAGYEQVWRWDSWNGGIILFFLFLLGPSLSSPQLFIVNRRHVVHGDNRQVLAAKLSSPRWWYEQVLQVRLSDGRYHSMSSSSIIKDFTVAPRRRQYTHARHHFFPPQSWSSPRLHGNHFLAPSMSVDFASTLRQDLQCH